MIEERNIKANEIKNGLININQTQLNDFYVLLDEWVKTGKKCTGIVNLKDLKKDLVYQLDEIKTTVVKLTVEGKYECEPKNNGNIRNKPCRCGSNKKFKKCCLI